MHPTESKVIGAYRLQSEAELGLIVKELIQYASKFPIIKLVGEMGTGKTTLVKYLMRELGVSEVSSPTFSLVNRYDTVSGIWYHFDLYRVADEVELLDFGFEEYIDSGNPCLIEWPQIASRLIDTPHLEVAIDTEGALRHIKISENS